MKPFRVFLEHPTYLFHVADILSKDKNFIHLTPFIRSRTSKEALNYPTPKYQVPKLYAIYIQFLEIKIKAIQVVVCYRMQKGRYAVDKAFL